MSDKHPVDLLEYLYGELPPQLMREAEEHIASCPACREELRSLRESMEQYRNLPKPTPPAGLAERAAQRALEADAAGESLPGDLPVAVPPTRPKPAPLEDDPPPARSWFFHPGWTVAAGVLLVFAVLIHVSPRRNQWYDQRNAAAVRAERTAVDDRSDTTVPAQAPAPARGRAEPLPGVSAKDATGPETPQPPPPASLSMAETIVSEEPVAVPAAAGQTFLAPAPGEQGVLPQFDAEAMSRMFGDDGLAEDEGPRIIDMDGGEPPRIIETPSPIDRAQLVQDLVFLIAMQLGEREFADARLGIDMLRRYDTEQADRLAAVLNEMESAQSAQSAEEAAGAPVDIPAASRAETATPTTVAEMPAIDAVPDPASQSGETTAATSTPDTQPEADDDSEQAVAGAPVIATEPSAAADTLGSAMEPAKPPTAAVRVEEGEQPQLGAVIRDLLKDGADAAQDSAPAAGISPDGETDAPERAPTVPVPAEPVPEAIGEVPADTQAEGREPASESTEAALPAEPVEPTPGPQEPLTRSDEAALTPSGTLAAPDETPAEAAVVPTAVPEAFFTESAPTADAAGQETTTVLQSPADDPHPPRAEAGKQAYEDWLARYPEYVAPAESVTLPEIDPFAAPAPAPTPSPPEPARSVPPQVWPAPRPAPPAPRPFTTDPYFRGD